MTQLDLIDEMSASRQREHARALRDDGMARAVKRAERVDNGWGATAYSFLVLHAQKNASFTTEELRKASHGEVPIPPDARAWGAIMAKARRRAVVEPLGYESAKDPRVHLRPVQRFRSLLYSTLV